ncbi:calcium-binding protein [Natronorubrum aibiense]|uniref:Calcium-binding protein n=2 Tax=Natronorubrum aibiense TaxID=348826 RepID=A0A5P9P7T8_9EURY|nr:calcium-binding protein [Natronorubrum aibiense]
MKKGALATTAVALGASATSGSVTAQEDSDGTVLVYGDDYQPGIDFEVISALNTSTKEDLLEDSGSEDDVFDDPDDWDAYIISYDLGTDAPTWGFLFTEDVSLSAGDSDTMGDDGQFRDSQLDLIEATPGASGNGGDTNGNGDEEEMDDEEDDGNGGANGGNGGADAGGNGGADGGNGGADGGNGGADAGGN